MLIVNLHTKSISKFSASLNQSLNDTKEFLLTVFHFLLPFDLFTIANEIKFEALNTFLCTDRQDMVSFGHVTHKKYGHKFYQLIFRKRKKFHYLQN